MKALSLLILTLSFNAMAGQTARVLMVRGDVTQLSPGAKQAKKVKKGDIYQEDTSVLTGDKAIVRLKFADKSVMNLGPKSKVVVSKMPKKKPNMINLLTGSIKAEVDKRNTGRNKMIVKTRSAVMGIRGTKFQAIYNTQNNNTSLVTVEGKVAMVKKDVVKEQMVKEQVKKEAAQATADGVVEEATEEVVKTAIDSDSELDALDEALNTSTETVEVEAGRFSGVQENAAKPSLPVKIAPKQYEVLAESMGSDKKAEDVMKTTDAEKELQALEKSVDKGQVLQKPGGYIDFQTGLYVPPSEDAKLDKKTGTFKQEKGVGEIDKVTGDYIPPKGVKLDAKEGFVVDKKELAKVADKGQVEKTLALVKNKNKEVKKQVVVNKMEAKSTSGKAWYARGEAVLGFEFIPYSEVLTLRTGDGGDSEFLTESASDVLFTYSRSWNKKWRTHFKLGFVNYEVDQSSDGNFREGQNNDDTIFIADTHMNLNKNWKLTFELMDRPYYFVYPGDNGDAVIDVFNLGSISFGGIYSWRTYNEVDVSFGGKLILFGSEEKTLDDGSDETFEGGGINLFSEGTYEFRKNMLLRAKLYMQNVTHELAGSSAEFERFTLGSQLVFDYML